MLITLNKAIELSKNLELPLKTAQDHDNHLAIRLGLAALEAIRFVRNGGTWHPEALLPGEQPEEIAKGG